MQQSITTRFVSPVFLALVLASVPTAPGTSDAAPRIEAVQPTSVRLEVGRSVRVTISGNDLDQLGNVVVLEGPRPSSAVSVRTVRATKTERVVELRLSKPPSSRLGLSLAFERQGRFVPLQSTRLTVVEEEKPATSTPLARKSDGPEETAPSRARAPSPGSEAPSETSRTRGAPAASERFRRPSPGSPATRTGESPEKSPETAAGKPETAERPGLRFPDQLLSRTPPAREDESSGTTSPRPRAAPIFERTDPEDLLSRGPKPAVPGADVDDEREDPDREASDPGKGPGDDAPEGSSPANVEAVRGVLLQLGVTEERLFATYQNYGLEEVALYGLLVENLVQDLGVDPNAVASLSDAELALLQISRADAEASLGEPGDGDESFTDPATEGAPTGAETVREVLLELGVSEDMLLETYVDYGLEEVATYGLAPENLTLDLGVDPNALAALTDAELALLGISRSEVDSLFGEEVASLGGTGFTDDYASGGGFSSGGEEGAVDEFGERITVSGLDRVAGALETVMDNTIGALFRFIGGLFGGGGDEE